MTFSEKLRLARESRNLTQQQLADAAGVSKRMIAAYESGESVARSSTARRLAAALQISFSYLTRDDILDPSHGLRDDPYFARAERILGPKDAIGLELLLEANTSLFAGGELDQKSKDAFFAAITRAYQMCRERASEQFGKGKYQSKNDYDDT